VYPVVTTVFGADLGFAGAFGFEEGFETVFGLAVGTGFAGRAFGVGFDCVGLGSEGAVFFGCEILGLKVLSESVGGW
jgi:hypothetical protein